jgi:hypothetical protein
LQFKAICLPGLTSSLAIARELVDRLPDVPPAVGG